MMAYHQICPEPGWREIRCLHVLESDGSMPKDEYAFVEFYCTDPECDCQRVVIQVWRRSHPGMALAEINFGWESAEFYARWMDGDAEAGRMFTSARLDPMFPQSQWADFFLDYFKQSMLPVPDYVPRLQAHYRQVKETITRKSASPTPASRPMPVIGTSPLDLPAILRQLSHLPARAAFAPYELALRCARTQPEAVIPELVKALERVCSNPEHYLDHPDESLHRFALCLLSEFHVPQAADVFLRFFSLPGENPLELTGDLVPEIGAAIMVSVFRGDPEPLLRLARDEEVNAFVREEAIRGLLLQAGWQERSRDAAVQDLRQLFQTLPRPGDSIVWSALVRAVCDADVPELLPEVRQAFADRLVDTAFIGPEDVETAFGKGWRRTENIVAARSEIDSAFLERYAPIDAVQECSSWVCFTDEEAEAEELDTWEEGDIAFDEAPDFPAAGPAYASRPQPYVAPPKVGRNHSCPCGSGRKFKKCCRGT